MKNSNFNYKKDTIHTQNSKQDLKSWLTFGKVHWEIEFEQKAWLRPLQF